jgi:hypothetical protein
MRISSRLLICLFAVCVTIPAGADVVTWTVEAPDASTTSFPVDFDGVLFGITNVVVQLTGYSADCQYHCDGIGGGYDMYLPWFASVDFALGREAVFNLPNMNTFDITNSAILPAGGDWLDFSDGRIDVVLTNYVDTSSLAPWCAPYGPYPEYYSLTVKVYCDSAVPTDDRTWGAVKSFYR